MKFKLKRTDGSATLLHSTPQWNKKVYDDGKKNVDRTFFGKTKVLAHHGVQGMKWGVHNEETQRRYAHLKAYGVSDKTLSKYVKADQKAWKAANASNSGESKNIFKNLAYKRADKKLDKARSALADEYINRTAPLGWGDEKNHSLGFASARRNMASNSNHGMSLDEAMKKYSADVTEFENTHRISQATKSGKEAVERYIKFGTTPNQKARSGIEIAAKDGYVLTSEKQGDTYRRLKANKEETQRKLDAFESNEGLWKKHSEDTYKPKTKKLEQEYDRLLADRSKARGEYDSFVSDKYPYTYDPGNKYKGRYYS